MTCNLKEKKKKKLKLKLMIEEKKILKNL